MSRCGRPCSANVRAAARDRSDATSCWATAAALASLAAATTRSASGVTFSRIDRSNESADTSRNSEIASRAIDSQDRARWDRLLITHGLAALDRAEDIGATGSYAIQAKIAACHARAPRAEDTDWVRICSLYGDDLVALTRSPIAELEPCGCRVDGRWTGRRARRDRRIARRCRAAQLLAAECARRPAGEARPLRRSTS